MRRPVGNELQLLTDRSRQVATDLWHGSLKCFSGSSPRVNPVDFGCNPFKSCSAESVRRFTSRRRALVLSANPIGFISLVLTGATTRLRSGKPRNFCEGKRKRWNTRHRLSKPRPSLLMLRLRTLRPPDPLPKIALRSIRRSMNLRGVLPSTLHTLGTAQ